MKIQLPEKVKVIIQTLEAAGYEAYAVGGCVRDSVLGRIPADWDITTSALPEQVKELFHRTIDTGIEHGTVTVMMDKEGFEVTTYRIDGEYRDHRHPEQVNFTGELKEDLRRRDFTINAMAYNDRCGMVDAFGGIEDLKHGVIRCVGVAGERFEEDALRILRAVRFAAQLGFEIEKETADAARALAGNLKDISAERIQTELVKLLVSPHPEMLRTAYELGITRVVLPEFDVMMETPQHHPHHMYSVGEHTLKALEFTDPEKVLRLSVLFHDFGKPQTRTTVDGVDHFHGHANVSAQETVRIMRRLKFDNATMDQVKRIVLYHDARPQPDERQIRRLLHRAGEDIFPGLFQVMGADILAQSEYRKIEKLVNLERVHQVYDEILKRKDCISLKNLQVTGKDLIAAGMEPGKKIGEILNQMLEDVLETPEHNEREYLLKTYGNSAEN
ncbi:CCA-adding enzyme [uncultured Clostridium sp.]|uniref:CCA tRNA nucleotidyltransferase n=1 Tax=Muricoprocola aceti TaxID=2981772 RepID=A0ABT2SMP3_9FIRM|nr:CCA tRNA nucleotidyltransferase [Muricoprocola aceti]MCI7227125.1 CCA tRNA nucleotidyltransferase [Lachnospiraceae bacterium]RGD65685.1 CCA tRNA nucleotidyltransferase [Lachnospiraceae bacterium OF09-6]SCH47749.1 CCA-adding enzyme [uncultured Clostridium sp.]MCU6725343.1 CCA tRNA nucleotidyltransferase [Muricoprocola aceti]MDD7437097.1 CCA tRNA nucleotidyltransferase [Lachnospiraceae bacterium]